ncbi:MAG TPA: hypothetical protein VH137_09150, partial [Gemmatimonadales bacterium]|nr:hypothetical protein [Gemmatimonadales bacterium]
GTLLTVGSAAIAQLAVQSAVPARPGAPTAAAPDPALPDVIWQGGAVAPITVEARAVAPIAATLSELGGRTPSAAHRAPARRAHRAVATGAPAGAAVETALPTTTTH